MTGKSPGQAAFVRTSRRSLRGSGDHRTFLYRHRPLLALVHAAEFEHADQDLAGATRVSRASLQADLTDAQARKTRLAARVQQLEKRLSEALGEQVWREAGPGCPRRLRRTPT